MKKKAPSVSSDHIDFIDDKSAALLLNTPNSARVILWAIAAFFVIAILWASLAKLDKVTSGGGKIIPSSQLQVVQNLEGGIVKKVLVREGQHVEKGQQILLIDDTLFQSNYREKAQDVASLKADSIRLNKLIQSVVINKIEATKDWQKTVAISQEPLNYDAKFTQSHPRLVQQQKNEYHDVFANLSNQLDVAAEQIKQKKRELKETQSRIYSLASSYKIAKKEYNITKPLAEEGVVPQIELLKLQRSLNDTNRDLTSAQMQVPVLNAGVQEVTYKYLNIALDFRAKMQQELSDVSAKLASMTETQIGLEDRVARTVVTSPVKGTIQKIHVNTVGGVIQPGMDLVEIVPTEDNLLIEIKIAPQDIGFLHPGLNAIIKFTAYDFTNYGGLKWTLETISADTIQDEEGNSYYLVRIRTEENNLVGPTGESLPIIPGMTTSADIITGKRSVLDYLLKPILKARQTALRE